MKDTSNTANENRKIICLECSPDAIEAGIARRVTPERLMSGTCAVCGRTGVYGYEHEIRKGRMEDEQ